MASEDRGIRAEAITVRFGGITALAEVDLEVRPGEIVGLIGPNGAGKTTMINVLSGFQAPSHGTVRIAGEAATGLSPQRVARRGVARTFQAARLFGDLSVLENVEVAAIAAGLGRRAARERALRLLEWVGCGERPDQPASALPFGRERLVGIARALAAGPSFLLLDEPAAGLDEGECGRLSAFIARIPGEWGCGVLLIEHNIPLVLEICQRIQVLDGGRTIAVESPAGIAGHPEVRRVYLGLG
jgi:branched-chain amino acid transport system ATP-binding protein